MPSFFNISFSQKAIELTPPDKRAPSFIKWLYSLIAPIQYNSNSTFIDYKTGADYPNYNALNTYSRFDRVIYGQSVYESLIDNNTDLPTINTSWRIYQEFFIGVDERLYYNHCKISLEYALNKRFDTQFRQPPLISDIYIETNQQGTNVFVVGHTELESSVVYGNTSSEYVINDYTFGTFTNFTVYVPIAVYEGVSADPTARESIFRFFIDKYNSVGLTYNIVTY
jgi:hypothetical protein